MSAEMVLHEKKTIDKNMITVIKMHIKYSF